MKKLIIPTAAALSAAIFLTGCVASVGGGTKNQTQPATVGQQLIDLKKAKDVGAISDSEYEAQKAKILAGQAK